MECELLAALERSLGERARRELVRPQRAAVLVPIVVGGSSERLLLTRRTENLPTHPGQVAFPGGYIREPGEDAVAAALREAQEEIGLPPERVRVLGLLDDLPTHTDAVAVTPVVALIEDLPALRPQTNEVARIFTIPLAELGESGRWRSGIDRTDARERTVHYFDHDGETLWGLSARIVLGLLSLGPGGAPAGLSI